VLTLFGVAGEAVIAFIGITLPAFRIAGDRLWLVKDGAVSPYQGDLEDYRKMLLTPEDSAKASQAKAEAPKVKKPGRDEILALKAEVRKCEERLAKLNDMRDKLAKKLADPALYEEDRKGDLGVWNGKYAEVMNALDRAEAMWLSAQETLENAIA